MPKMRPSDAASSIGANIASIVGPCREKGAPAAMPKTRLSDAASRHRRQFAAGVGPRRHK